MSRGTLRFVVVALVVAGGLTLATPQAEAAGREVRSPDLWSLALGWIGKVWKEEVVGSWEAEGWMIDPNGVQGVAPEGGGGDEGWMIDPNG
jgi:hypothetical protein